MITVVEYDKKPKRLTVHENINWKEFQSDPENLYWWDLNEPTEEESECLAGYFNFHPLAVDDCLADIQYPKVDFYETYLYLLIHGVDVDRTRAEGFAPKELDIFLGPNYLVTFHKKETRSVSEVLRRCKENTPIFDYGIDFVLYTILDILVTNYLPVLEEIEDELDKTEQELFEDPKSTVLRRILNLKRTLLKLKKTIFPQREVMNHLARNEYQFITRKTQFYFRDVYDMLYRMAEMTESFRDVTTAMVETYLSTVSNRLNEVMKALTLITTIFMPLTVITGIYGMNFADMPELRWKYGYFVVLCVMVIVGGGLFSYFRHRKWI
ncbi:magnesium/cobalt transporter CorA [bacterium]|nr:magnesium/cobalt transporter CorA [bacterium]MCI0601401.1 magnesium/cobalt transporter CorA [bacterium]